MLLLLLRLDERLELVLQLLQGGSLLLLLERQLLLQLRLLAGPLLLIGSELLLLELQNAPLELVLPEALLDVLAPELVVRLPQNLELLRAGFSEPTLDLKMLVCES